MQRATHAARQTRVGKTYSAPDMWRVRHAERHAMTCGAENKMANVDATVNRVNMNKHRRSMTIAANFQSLHSFASTSSRRTLSVSRRSSERMFARCDLSASDPPPTPSTPSHPKCWPVDGELSAPESSFWNDCWRIR